MASDVETKDGQADAEGVPEHETAPFWPPVWTAICGGYRLIGEHLVAIAVTAVMLSACSIVLLFELPRALASNLAFVALLLPALPYVFALTNLALMAAVCAVLAGRWLRRQLLGEKQRLEWPTPRDLKMALVLFVFLAVTTYAPDFALGGTDVGYFASQAILDGRDIPFATSAVTLAVWNLLFAVLMALLFPVLPAIAVDAGQPLLQAMRLARRAFPRLVAIFFIGMLPWTVLDGGATDYLVFVVSDLDLIGPGLDPIIRRIRFATEMVEVWSLLCGVALAGAAYRDLADRDIDRRIGGIFD